MLSDLQIMNKWASVLTGYKSTGERIFEFARAIETEVRKDYEALIRDAIDRVEPAPQPAGFVLVPVEPTQEMEDAAYRNSSTYGSGPGADYRAMIAAAPKADHIAGVSKMVPAPLQQGEYLPCPFCGNVSINLTVIDDRSFIMCNSCGACCDSIDTLPESEPGDVWNRRAARGAAQAAPAPASGDVRSAAQALVDRWDTPKWKDAEHTGAFIQRLREALAAPQRKRHGCR